MKLSRAVIAAAALVAGAVAFPVSASLTVVEKKAAPPVPVPPVYTVEEGERLRSDNLRATAEIVQLRADLARVQAQLEHSERLRRDQVVTLHRSLDDIERRMVEVGNALVRIQFGFNSTRFTPDAAQATALVAAGKQAGAVHIVGHADNAGPAAANRQVAMQRAVSARQYLVERGVARDKVTVASRGADEPLLDNLSEDGRARNRRVEIDFRR